MMQTYLGPLYSMSDFVTFLLLFSRRAYRDREDLVQIVLQKNGPLSHLMG